MMAARSIEERVAVLETTITDLDREVLRVRGRVHDLESDRATIRLLLEQAKAFAQQLHDLAEHAEELSKRSAHEAVTALLERRADVTRVRWSIRAQWVGTGIAAGGFVSAIVFGVLH